MRRCISQCFTFNSLHIRNSCEILAARKRLHNELEKKKLALQTVRIFLNGCAALVCDPDVLRNYGYAFVLNVVSAWKIG